MGTSLLRAVLKAAVTAGTEALFFQLLMLVLHPNPLPHFSLVSLEGEKKSVFFPVNHACWQNTLTHTDLHSVYASDLSPPQALPSHWPCRESQAQLSPLVSFGYRHTVIGLRPYWGAPSGEVRPPALSFSHFLMFFCLSPSKEEEKKAQIGSRWCGAQHRWQGSNQPCRILSLEQKAKKKYCIKFQSLFSNFTKRVS